MHRRMCALPAGREAEAREGPGTVVPGSASRTSCPEGAEAASLLPKIRIYVFRGVSTA